MFGASDFDVLFRGTGQLEYDFLKILQMFYFKKEKFSSTEFITILQSIDTNWNLSEGNRVFVRTFIQILQTGAHEHFTDARRDSYARNLLALMQELNEDKKTSDGAIFFTSSPLARELWKESRGVTLTLKLPFKSVYTRLKDEIFVGFESDEHLRPEYATQQEAYPEIAFTGMDAKIEMLKALVF